MKYTQSQDGIMRTSIKLDLRLSESEINLIKGFLVGIGKSTKEKDIREFLKNRLEAVANDDLYEIFNGEF